MKSLFQHVALVATLAITAFSLQSCAQDENALKQIKQEAVIDAIMTRSSVRSYTDQVVEDEKIEVMLKAGMAAPTAGNKQPWEFIVIKEREILDALPYIAGGMKMAPKAQLAIAVCGVTTRTFPNIPDYWVQDCSAATQNILLAAHAMGLGAVWCGAYPDGGTGRVAKASELFALPEGVYALSVIIIGYPDSEPKIKDKWNAERVHYNRF